METLRYVAETVTGNFVFTVLRNDNTLYLIKGDNPLTICHYPELGLYVYASTQDILAHALRAVKLFGTIEQIAAEDGNIVAIDASGNVSVSTFKQQMPQFHFHPWILPSMTEPDDDYADDLLLMCGCYGVDREDVELLLDIGYTPDEVEEMLMDEEYFQEAITEAKTLFMQ